MIKIKTIIKDEDEKEVGKYIQDMVDQGFTKIVLKKILGAMVIEAVSYDLKSTK